MEKHKILQEIDVRIKALEVRRQSSGTGSLIRMSINGGIIQLNGFREWLVHVEDTGDILVHDFESRYNACASELTESQLESERYRKLFKTWSSNCIAIKEKYFKVLRIKDTIQCRFTILEKSFKRRSFLGFEWYIKTK
mgnify:CR=1 FL=1